jgi:glycosyltransferase involved in cell wall biosynthesis
MVSEHASPLAVLGGEDAGGQNVHVAALSGALAEAGHRVEVYTRRDDPHLPPKVALRPGVDVVHVPAGPAAPLPKDDLLRYMPRFGDWLAARWRHRHPDVVHAHFWMSGTAALRARAALLARNGISVPVVQTFHALGSVKRRHQGSADTSPSERIGLEAWIAREADAVVATCSDEVRELAALLRGEPDALPVDADIVPCGVDLDAFTPVGPVATVPRRATYRVLCLGRLVERKGIDTAIAALASVPDTELLIAGGPPADGVATDDDCRRLMATAAAFGVRDRVRLLGRVSRVQAPALLRSADVLVAVPAYEPFGIVPVEAMACGVPVIASKVGGMLETVVDGVTGLHVPPADPQHLASALTTLLADPPRRAAMGRAGARRCAGRYGWPRIAEHTHHVYRRLVAAPRASARAAITAGATTIGAKAAG